MKLAITVTVKAIDTHRWVCRIQPFQFTGPPPLLVCRLRRPVWGLDAELLCVLRVQSLPAAEPHRVGTDRASDRGSAEKAIEHIEADVPPGSTHRDVALVDVGPQR